MHFNSSVSESESSPQAVEEVIAGAKAALGNKIDVAFAFFTGHHREDADAIVEKLWLQLDPQAVLGCSAEGIIGQDQEIEQSPGLCLLTGEISGVRLHPFHIATAEWKKMLTEPASLVERVGYSPQTRVILGFGDPFTTPQAQLLTAMDAACPGSPLVGGMASAARARGENALLKNDRVYNEGFVGVSLSGDVDVQTVVSQGCRPIGRAMIVTRGKDNVIEQLGGRPALEVLSELVGELPAEDKELLTHGLLIGRAISEYKENFGSGDFLVRNLAGANEETGAIAVADFVRTGQTVQFHLRDAATAHEDLETLLAAQKKNKPAAGGLLFSCNGRGTRLFSEPGHDIGVARQAMPGTPIAGFFAAGEIGPVGRKNFIHGHTASFALFRPGKQ